MNQQESIFKCHYPKVFIKDLKRCKRNGETDTWLLDLTLNINNKDISKTVQFSAVQIQGILEEKLSDDVMLLKDQTGKVKLTKCAKANGSKENIIEGVYCSITGTLEREKGLPEISVIKMIKLGDDIKDNTSLNKYWVTEVEDYQSFAVGVLLPKIN